MKIYKYLVLSLLFVGLSSCEAWLDVTPSSTIKAPELIKTEEGFHKALIGVYINMSSSALYGGDLTMSVLDVLAQNYTTPMEQAKHQYEKFAKYEYKDKKVEARIDAIWENLYNCITGCNSIFESLDLQKVVFSDHYYEIVKGELLAIRAMLHLDALRLFAQAPKYGINDKAIPYVQYFGEERVPFSTSKEVLQYIIRDLKNACDLLEKNDPIVVTNDIATNPNNNYFENRQSRMNFYAVKAILARAYLWAGDYHNAKECALDVYNSNHFALVTDKALDEIVEKSGSLTFRNEHIMSIYVDQLQVNRTKYIFDKDDPSTVLAINTEIASDLYSPSDKRYMTWFAELSDVYDKITKYKYGQHIPMIKISEILLILTESSDDINEAATYLNKLRRERGMGEALVTNFNITDLLLSEYQREFIGEGVLFYQYKRYDRTTLPNSIVLKDTKAVYNLPIPKSELEFAQ